MVMKGRGFAKSSQPLKDDVVALIANKIKKVLFQSLQICCMSTAESSLQLNLKKNFNYYRASKLHHITVDETSHHNYTKSLNHKK